MYLQKGDITPDTVFNGLIRFYDTTTNKLVIEATYTNGKLNGKRKDYYLNGNIKGVGYYENGKQNGTTSFFDTAGRLVF
jgi:antitoxin component YwqK of YwqJK toxin-antitoxin module